MNLFNLESQDIDEIDFSDKVYLITGAANGIGRALSTALTKSGATVILLDKDDTQLNSVYDEISNNSKGEPIIVHQDLSQLEQNHCEALASQIVQSLGKLNGIIHCAAEIEHLAPLEHCSMQDWHKIINANLHAPYLLTRNLLPLMTDDGFNTIIFTVSEQADQASAFWGAFAVAQYGIKALVETWSAETENKNTNFVMLNPGKVNTNFLTRLYPGLNADNYPQVRTIVPAYIHLLTSQTNDLHGKFVQVKDSGLEISAEG